MPKISKQRFRFVYERIINTGVPEYIEHELRPTGKGRPRALTVALLLTAFVLTFDHRKTATLRNARRVLLKDISRDLQVELGLRWTLRGRAFRDALITYRKISYLWEAIVDVLDPNATTDGFERARRRDFLRRLGTEATLAITPGWQNRKPLGHAVDGTPLRGYHRKSSHWDKEGTVGHRTPTPNDRREFYFGYRILAYCTIGDGKNFIEAFTVFAANLNEAGPANVDLAQALVSLLLSVGRTVGVLVADKGFSQRKIRKWMNPMRALGFDLVFDLKTGDGGAPVMENGALVIDARPHCPYIPEKYQHLPRPKTLTVRKPGKKATQEDLDAYEKRRKAIKKLLKLARERAQYEGAHHEGKGWGPGDRWYCPAIAGRLRCPLHPHTLNFPTDRPKVHIHDGVVRGNFCNGKRNGVTIHWSVHQKIRQSLTWLSPEWCRIYAMRTSIERVFSILKSRDGEALTHGWTRTKGQTAITLMVWTAVAHYNLAQEAGTTVNEEDDDDPGFLELDPVADDQDTDLPEAAHI